MLRSDREVTIESGNEHYEHCETARGELVSKTRIHGVIVPPTRVNLMAKSRASVCRAVCNKQPSRKQQHRLS